MLSDPGTDGAHDDIVITLAAAAALRTFGFVTKPAPAEAGFTDARVAPRWVTEFAGVVARELQRGGAKYRLAVETITRAAPGFVRRASADPDLATAVLVVLETGGLEALATFIE